MGDRIDNLTIDGKKLIKELKVLELRAELERRGLSKYGNKKELLQRLSIFEENRQKSLSGQPSREAPNQWLENEADLNNDFLREYFRSQKALFQEHAQRRTEIGVGEAPNVALRKEQFQSNDEFALSTSHRESFSPPKIAPTSPSKKKKKKKKNSSDDEKVTYTPPLYESSLATSRPSRSSAQTSRALNVVSFDDEDSESAEVDPYVFDIKEKKKGHKKHHRIPTLKLHSPTVDSVSQQKSLLILSSYSGEEKVPSLKIKLPEPVPKISTSIISPTKDSINRKLKIRKDESELCKTSSIFKKTSKVCLSPQNAEVSSSVEEIVTDSLVKSVPDSCADSTSNEGNSSSDNEKRISSVEDKVASHEVRDTDSSKTPHTLNLKISSKKLSHLGNQQWYSENNIQKDSLLSTPNTRNVITSVVSRKQSESSLGQDSKTPTSHIQSEGVKPTVRKRGRPRLYPIPSIIPSPQVDSGPIKPCASAVPPCKVVIKNEQIVQSGSSKPCTSAVLPCKEVTKSEQIVQSGSFKSCTSAVTAVTPSKVVTKNELILQSGSFKPSTGVVTPCKVVAKNELILQSGFSKPCTSTVSPCKVIPNNEQSVKKLEDQKLSSSQQSIENQIKEDLINLRLKELDIKESKLKLLSASYHPKTSTLASNSLSITKKVDESIRRSSRLYKPLPAETVKKKNEPFSLLMKPSKPIPTSKPSLNKFSDQSSTENIRTCSSSEQPDYFESLKQQIEMPLYVEKFPSDKSEVSSSTSELSETIKPVSNIAGVPCSYQPFTQDTPILDAHMVMEGHTSPSHANTVSPDDRNIGSSLMVSSLPKINLVKPNLESSCTSVGKKSGYLIKNLIVKASEKELTKEISSPVVNTCEISLLKVASTSIKDSSLQLEEKSTLESENSEVATGSTDNKNNLKDLIPFEANDQKRETGVVVQASEMIFTKCPITASKKEIGIDVAGDSSLPSVKLGKKENKQDNCSHSIEAVKNEFLTSSILLTDNSASQPIDKTDGRSELTNLDSPGCSSVHDTFEDTKTNIDTDGQDQIFINDINQILEASSLGENVQQKLIQDDSTPVPVIKKLCEATLPSATLFDLKIAKIGPEKMDAHKVGNLSSSVIKLFASSSSLENKNISSEILRELGKSPLSSKFNLNAMCADLATNSKPSISNVNAETKEIKKIEETDVLLRPPSITPTSAADTSETLMLKGESDMMSFKDILMEAALAADIDSDDLTESLCSNHAETFLTITKGSKGTHDVSNLNPRLSLDFSESLGGKLPATVTGVGGCRPHSKKHDFIEKLSANVYNAKKESSKGLMEIIFDLDKRAKQTSEVEEKIQNIDFNEGKCQTLPTTSPNLSEVGHELNIGLSSEKVDLGFKDKLHTNMENLLLLNDSSEKTVEDKFKSQSFISSPATLDSPNETASVSEEEVNFFREVMESVPELGKKKPCFEPVLKLRVSQDALTEHTCSKTREQPIDDKTKPVTPVGLLISDTHSCVSSKIFITSIPNLDKGPSDKDKSVSSLDDSQLEKPSHSIKKQTIKDRSELQSSKDGVIKSLSVITELIEQKAKSEITDINKLKAKSEITNLNEPKAKSNSRNINKLSYIENCRVDKLSSRTKAETTNRVEIEDCSQQVGFEATDHMAISNTVLDLNTFKVNSNSLKVNETIPVIDDMKLDVAAQTTDKFEEKSECFPTDSDTKMDLVPLTSSKNLSVIDKVLESSAESNSSFSIEKISNNKSEKVLDGIDVSAVKVDKPVPKNAEEVHINNLNSSNVESISTLGETPQKVTTELLNRPKISNVVSQCEKLKEQVAFNDQQEISDKGIIPDFELSEVAAEMLGEVKLEREESSVKSDSFSIMPVNHATQLASKSLVQDAGSPPVPCEAMCAFKNPSSRESVELGQVIPKLFSLVKAKIDLQESKSVCQFSSPDNSMDSLRNLFSGVEAVNSQTNKHNDPNIFSTSYTLPVISSIDKNVNLESKHYLPKEVKEPLCEEASVTIVEDKASPQLNVENDNFQYGKNVSKERISTSFLIKEHHNGTKIDSQVSDSFTATFSDDISKTCNIIKENITHGDGLSSGLDESLDSKDSDMDAGCQIKTFPCNLGSAKTKLYDLTQKSLQVSEVCDFKLHVEPTIKDENLKHKHLQLMSTQPYNDVFSLISTNPSVDESSSNHKQQKLRIEQTENICGDLSKDQTPVYSSASYAQVPDPLYKGDLTKFFPVETETLQIDKQKIPSDSLKIELPKNDPKLLCTEQNDKNIFYRNSHICKSQNLSIMPQGDSLEISHVGKVTQDSCSNLAKQELISKAEGLEHSLARKKIEIPFIRSFQDNSARKRMFEEKLKVNNVESFQPHQCVDAEKVDTKVKFDYKKKTFALKTEITSESIEFSSSFDSKKTEVLCSAENDTQLQNIKQMESDAIVLPKEGILLEELGPRSELEKVNIKEFPFMLDISSIPLPPVINQDKEEDNTSVVPIVKSNSLCDSNEGNIVADKMARKNKNTENLVVQRESNNGDTTEGEHSPKRMNTRQRSKSREKDLVAAVEVEKRTGKLRRSTRGDKAVSENVDNKLDSDKNGTNNNQCLDSIAELNESSVKDDAQLISEKSDVPSNTITASIDNPADIPMPDIASVPLPEPKSASVIESVPENPVVISDNSVISQPDVQYTESNVDQQEKVDELDAKKAVEVVATSGSIADKKDVKASTSIKSKRSSTEETSSHSKRRGHSRSRSASSTSDRSSSKRKSSRKSRHSSSRRRSPSSSGRNHRKSSRYSKHSSHKADARSRSRSVENASSMKKRDECRDEKDGKKKKDDKKVKEDKKDKEGRVEKDVEDGKRRASKESDETLDKPEIQDTSLKMTKEENVEESADKNAKDKKLKERTSSSRDRDSRRDSSKRERSSSKDSKNPSSRRESSKSKDIAEDSSCKDSGSNLDIINTCEVPKNSEVSSSSKNVERSISEENETVKEGSTDDPVIEADTVKQVPEVVFKSARKVSLLRPKSIGEEEQEKPKKRKWGSSATAKSSLEISSNSLKTLIPDVMPLSPSEVTMKYSSESSDEETEAEVEINLKVADQNDLMNDLMSDSEEKYFEKTVEVKKDDEEKDEISKVEEDLQPEISPNKRKRSDLTDARKREKHEKRESRRERNVKEISPRRRKKHSPEKAERPFIARKVSVVEAGPYSYKPSIAPPQNPVSRVIIINNLTRPFTVKAITDLLLRTGRLSENGFWMDRIKSTCLAMFETVDQAEETRSALHGVKWPADNNKNLFVDFVTEKDLKEKLSDKDNSLPTYSADEQRRDRRKFEGPIREWDLAKVGERSPGEREREKERQRREREEERERDKRRREQSPKEERKPKKPPPVKSVDDLFKKTKARPFIYWLPLTPEQIVEKEALRRKKMAESERMLAEIKEQERLRQKKREKEREQREKEREQREKEREQREKERNAKRSKSRSRRRSGSRSARKSPRRSPRRTRRSGSRDSRKSHRRSRSRSRS